MAMAAKAYARQQRRKAGDKTVRPLTIREQVLAEMHMEAEGPTIQVTDQELQAAPSSLTFEQLYRRILRTFEEHKLPERMLLFEMLKKSKAQEDWDNFVIIAKVYQSKLLVLSPTQASHLIHLAINQGFLNQMYDQIHKNVLFVYPTKAGYHKLIEELMKAGQLDKIWKTLQLMAERDILPSRETFKALVHHYHSTDVDTAMKLFSVCSKLGVRTTSVMAYEIARKLAELERWSDIVEVEKIAKKDNPNHSFRKLMSLLFIKSHAATGDMEGAAQLAQHDYNAFLQDDLKDTHTMADAKNTFPFISELVDQLIPQLVSKQQQQQQQL